MIKGKITGLALSVMMAATVFSVPGSVLAAETEGTDEAQIQPDVAVEEFAEEEPADAQDQTEETTPDATAPAESEQSAGAPAATPQGDAPQVFSKGLTAKATEYDKYKAYLSNYGERLAEYADYDDQTVYGQLPYVDYYNEQLTENGQPESMKITESDMNKFSATAKIGGKTYTVRAFQAGDEDYQFEIKFDKVAPGTPVNMTYTMGSYTKTENLLVTKYVEPTVVGKHYTYDGKVHKGVCTIKVGKETLVQGKDYTFSSTARKDVGYGWVEAYSTDNCKYRFRVGGSFYVYPKGTSVKKLKKGKKAITVKWKKQSEKMSRSRITGYQIQLATNKAFTKNKKTVTVKGYKNVSRKVKKLKKKTKYYVRVRTYKYVDETYVYSKWSAAKSVKTR